MSEHTHRAQIYTHNMKLAKVSFKVQNTSLEGKKRKGFRVKFIQMQWQTGESISNTEARCAEPKSPLNWLLKLRQATKQLRYLLYTHNLNIK